MNNKKLRATALNYSLGTVDGDCHTTEDILNRADYFYSFLTGQYKRTSDNEEHIQGIKLEPQKTL
jgi:hypothetical protein